MKWKNYGLWVSISSVLYMVLEDLGYQIDLTRWETYVTGILGILAALGIISNPENGKGFFNAKTPPSSKLEDPPEEKENGGHVQQQPGQITDQASDQSFVDTQPYRRYPPNEK
ncbi:hypothetical protein [uncultured Metabacillus sp.]|uniref:hypothetical protein n=1 Tax=uncultured Metabacillus sp. TaxID=2860135 RepID=UPI00260EABF7|nr:hypothetical protein [uncultured Metabacillus sp.]